MTAADCPVLSQYSTEYNSDVFLGYMHHMQGHTEMRMLKLGFQRLGQNLFSSCNIPFSYLAGKFCKKARQVKLFPMTTITKCSFLCEILACRATQNYVA